MKTQSKADLGIGYDTDFFPQRNENLVAQVETFLEKIEVELGHPRGPSVNRGKSDTVKSLKPQDINFATDVACYCFDDICQTFYIVTKDTPKDDYRHYKYLYVVKALVCKPLKIRAATLIEWLRVMLDISERSKDVSKHPQAVKKSLMMDNWPIDDVINLILKQSKKAPLTKAEIELVRSMLSWEEFSADYSWYETIKLRVQINEILNQAKPGGAALAPCDFSRNDHFGATVEAHLNTLSDAETLNWHRIMHLASMATGSKPTGTFIKRAEELATEMGEDNLYLVVKSILHYAVTAPTYCIPWVDLGCDPQLMGTDTYEIILHPANLDLLKGVPWIAILFQDSKIVKLVADLCEKAMQDTYAGGPVSQAVANACIVYLDETPGAEAAAQLSRLAGVIKHKSVQKKLTAIIAKRATKWGSAPSSQQSR